jgi:tyrosyl-tRNA synthetase
MKAAFLCVGGDPDKLKFVLGSELYAQNALYWETVIRVARETTLSRAKRSVDIMGRVAGEEMPTATIFYPMMQVADIFALGVDIAHAGTDQRKAHVIARDTAPALKRGKPIALHHHLALGMTKPPVWPIPAGEEREAKIAMKMSKSKPDSAVFIHDSPDEIREKIKKSFCPPKEIMYNPMLDWVKHVLFLGGEGEFEIKRSPGHGGAITLSSEDLPKRYAAGEIHPEDLKNAVAEALIKMLEPARNHFASGAPKGMLEKLETLISR